MRLEKKRPSAYNVYAGIGWYRRYFRADPQDRGRRHTVVFDGVQTDCAVYLNGEKLTEHFGGTMGFVVDIPDEVLFDHDNVLAVHISNVLQEDLVPDSSAVVTLDVTGAGSLVGHGIGWSASGATVPQALTVELTDPHDLAGVRVHWGKDSSWCTYDLQASPRRGDLEHGVLRPAKGGPVHP